MELKGKALFNLLRISWLEDHSVACKPWQIEDLQELPLEELFFRLKKLGLILNEKSFYLYAENCESPEELVEHIWLQEEDIEGHDQTYLLLFELWRRLLPGKLCLSVFCDELDQLIELYDNGELGEEESLQNALGILEDILDDATDEQGDPKLVFETLAAYCAHDLERFIYDYIADQLAEKNETYASELLDAFYAYASDKRLFKLLRCRLFALSDFEHANRLYEGLLEELLEDPNIDLLIEIIESLIRHADIRLFMQAVKQALPLLKTEEEFQKILSLITMYFRCLDQDTEADVIQKLLDNRPQLPPNTPLDIQDKTFLHILNLIK